MTNEKAAGDVPYEITIAEGMAEVDSGRFEGCSVRPMPGGGAVVTTPLLDQSALHGLLRKIRDSGMTLVSINPSDKEHT